MQQEDRRQDGIHQLTPLFSTQEIVEEQLKCPALGPVMKELKAPGSVGVLEEEAKCVLRKRSRLSTGGILIIRIWLNPRTTKISTTLEVPEASYDSTGLKHTSLELFSAKCVETEVLGVKGDF